MAAREGEGERVSKLLLEAADDLRAEPGCELYLISREGANPDVVWVTELWRSEEELEAVLERIRGSKQVEEVMRLVAEVEMIELDFLGGKGVAAGDARAFGHPHSIVTIAEAEDLAPRFGYGDVQEARFPNEDLATEQTGLSHLRLKPNARQPFAHRHRRAEEIYTVLSGSGRVKLDDEVAEVAAGDAIRVSPGVTRGFMAGPDGLELLAFGPRHPGDAEVVGDPGWWGAEDESD